MNAICMNELLLMTIGLADHLKSQADDPRIARYGRIGLPQSCAV